MVTTSASVGGSAIALACVIAAIVALRLRTRGGR